MKANCTLLIFSFIFLSCSRGLTPAKNFSEDIIIHQFENEKGELEFRCFTKREFTCSNFTIDNSVQKKNEVINIRFTGITKPPICLTALGPAKASLNLGVLPPGIYKLRIANGHNLVATTLAVTNSGYTIENNNSRSVTFENNFLKK